MNIAINTQSAHKDADKALKAFVRKNELELSCKRGCFSCCFAMVVTGLGEAQYMVQNISPEQKDAAIKIGASRLSRLAKEKSNPNFATEYFLEKNRCPFLGTSGECTAHAYRPLACRGVVTNLDPKYCEPGAVPGLGRAERKIYKGQLGPLHGPEHYLQRPWRSSEQSAQKLWTAEQKELGFTVVGELASFINLLSRPDFQDALTSQRKTTQYLEKLGVLGGDFGFWVD